jgi:hypothetical protein
MDVRGVARTKHKKGIENVQLGLEAALDPSADDVLINYQYMST